MSPPTRSLHASIFVNPLTSNSSADKENLITKTEKSICTDNKENEALPTNNDKENLVPTKSRSVFKDGSGRKIKSLSTGTNRVLKPFNNSLEFCMQMNEPDFGFKSKFWDSLQSDDHSTSLNVWDFSDSEAAPAASWSTLPNRALLFRPLPLDIGRCTCVIVKEAAPKGYGGTLYSLYTNEGQGRQDRLLAIAYHKRHKGKSEFTVAQNMKGIFSGSDDSVVGSVSANLMGSKYQIWNQARCLKSKTNSSSLLAVVTFVPTIATWTGSYRTMRVYVPKHQSMQLKNTTQMQHIHGLPNDWEGHMEKVHKLCSKTPQYNSLSKQYELDFRDRGRTGLRIQKSVKNFQLKLEENGKQTILQLGRVGKSKFVMDFRYPLTGYQAFCICLASIDSKLCCTI